MDAQSPPQLKPVPAQFVGKNFQPGRSPNPGGRQPSAAYLKAYAELVEELGSEPTASQRLIIDRLAKVKTRPGYKCTDATVVRLLKQLGLPRRAEPAPTDPLQALHDHIAEQDAQT